jgi:hypothetical protein
MTEKKKKKKEKKKKRKASVVQIAKGMLELSKGQILTNISCALSGSYIC